MPALVPCEVVADLERVLEELLRIITRLADGQVREHVIRRGRQLGNGQQVSPIEVAVAELELLEQIAADDVRPVGEGVARFARAMRGLRRMLRSGQPGERIPPIPVRRPHREMILARHAVVRTTEETVLRQLRRKGEVLARQC